MYLPANNINQLFLNALQQLFYEGEKIEVRGKKTIELHPYFATLDNPLNRTLMVEGRGNNPFATLAETMWVLAGRNDVEWLKYFLPRAPDFSDDGKVWRAGYGPRIRSWNNRNPYIDATVKLEMTEEEMKEFKEKWEKQMSGPIIGKIIETKYVESPAKIDQVKWVIKQLEKDSYSRQAVISIWDPAEECTVEQTKDYPCNDWLHFMIRNDKLDCEVVVRSNDVVWGYSAINVYEWTVLQEIIAGALGIEVGKYYHYTSSMHIYDNYFDKAKKMLEKDYVEYGLPPFRFVDKKIDIDKYLHYVEEICRWTEFHTGQVNARSLDFRDIPEPLKRVRQLLECYCMFKEAKAQDALNQEVWDRYYEIMSRQPFSDLKVSCHAWLMRNIMKKKGYTFLIAIKDVRAMQDMKL